MSIKKLIVILLMSSNYVCTMNFHFISKNYYKILGITPTADKNIIIQRMNVLKSELINHEYAYQQAYIKKMNLIIKIISELITTNKIDKYYSNFMLLYDIFPTCGSSNWFSYLALEPTDNISIIYNASEQAHLVMKDNLNSKYIPLVDKIIYGQEIDIIHYATEELEKLYRKNKLSDYCVMLNGLK